MSHPNNRPGPNQPTIAAAPDEEAAVTRSISSPGFPPSSPSSPQRVDPYIGRTLDGRYVVEQLLGEGGMGVVYLGRHKVIDKRVAIKILRGDMAADAEMVERFLNEARAASSIGNPHIVDISDFGQLDDGATYFVMEFLDGRGLGELMTTSGVIPIPRLVHIAKQIARGLSAAHARGIVHRDLKPDNVMLIERGDDTDFVKVLDFGIAKVSSEAGKLTRAGSVFGTPHYMSPEQAAGVPVDQRTDIYSLGVILYEMASGKVPFDADNFMGILTQHMYKSPAPIRALVPQAQDVPPGLEAIVLKSLSKRVDLRYQSMEELAQDLERVERGVVPEAVQEMMGRSGGFNVPADYFRKQVPGGPTMLPATPQAHPKNTVLKGVIAGAATMTFLVIAALVGNSVLHAKPERPDPNPVPSAAASVVVPPSATTAVPDVPAPPDPASILKVVQIVTVPMDAIVFEGTKNLGAAPVTVGVPPNGTVTIRIEHAGFVSKERVLDGKKSREQITLEPNFGKTTAGPKVGTGPKVPTPPPAPPVVKTTAAPLPPPPAVVEAPCDPPKFRDPFPPHICR
jgi:eukaryotic-like serine/threonine-protein kinase